MKNALRRIIILFFSSLGVHTCFSCKKADGGTIRCSISVCGKYYHEACIKKLRLARYESKGFVCPMHTCATCAVDDVRNPKAFKGVYVASESFLKACQNFYWHLKAS